MWLYLKHPHILPFLGVHDDQIYVYLVSPWMKNGNVMECILSWDRDEPVPLLKWVGEVAIVLSFYPLSDALDHPSSERCKTFVKMW